MPEDPSTGLEVGTTTNSPTTTATPTKPASTGGLGDLSQLFTGDNALTNILGLAGMLGGAGLSSNALSSAIAYINQHGQELQDIGTKSQGSADSYADALKQFIGGQNDGSNFWQQQMRSALGGYQNMGNSLPGLTNGNYLMEPGAGGGVGIGQELLNNLTGTAGGMANGMEVANNVASNRGQTQDSRGLVDRLNDILTGHTGQMQSLTNNGTSLLDSRGMTGGLNRLSNVGSGLLDNGGYNGQTSQVGQAGLDALQSGGMNNFLKSIQGGGLDMFQNGGMTPQLSQGLDAAMKLVQGGGSTGLNSGLASKGMSMLDSANLLPTSLVASGAMDVAGSQSASMAKNARREAALRGEGAGSVSSGNANDAMADFEDQALRAKSSALQGALTSQQGLGLQRGALGGNIATSAATDQRSREADALGSLSSLTNSASNRAGTGSSAGLNSQSIANALFGVGGNMALGANEQALQQMGLGSGMLQGANSGANANMGTGLGMLAQYMQGAQGAANGMNNTLGLENNSMNQALQSLISGSGTQGGLFNSAISQFLAGRNQAATTGLGMGGLMLNNQGQFQGALNSGQSGDLQTQLMLQGLNGNYLNYAGSILSHLPQMWNANATNMTNSIWGQLLSKLGASAIQPSKGGSGVSAGSGSGSGSGSGGGQAGSKSGSGNGTPGTGDLGGTDDGNEGDGEDGGDGGGGDGTDDGFEWE